ncbi:MAG: DNA cytosine methyltransferase [Flavobacteriia bacterium]|nr:DNA cytosine methyltransferase [Flavobacteriia bacterium]
MKVVSLYSGAGGLDLGFKKAGFELVWANDFNKKACESYALNIGDHIRCGDILQYMDELKSLQGIDLVIGGPPCQGFSVAGKMDPDDPRSKHVWNFAKVVDLLSPSVFVMENVKALGVLSKWEPLRKSLLERFRSLGYSVNYVVLNATEFDVPQGRERVFFIGFKGDCNIVPNLDKMLEPYKKRASTVRETFSVLDRAGTGNNTGLCKAKITLTPNPVLRKSPFAGMLFNGMGRPVRLDGYANTLPASMGGNKTPIVDELELYENKSGWVQDYHSSLLEGGHPSEFKEAPDRLRRLTVQEAAILQSFPLEYNFQGSQSSVFCQIGNAVPPNLGYRIALMIAKFFKDEVLEALPLDQFNQLDLKFYG